MRPAAGIVLAAGFLLAGCEAAGHAHSPAAGDTLVVAPGMAVEDAVAPVGRDSLPDFDEFPVEESFEGPPAEVVLGSADYGPRFRTRLMDAAAAGPDFAGHYTVASWGCGASCQMVAVIDARTGELSEQTLVTQNGVHYRPDSALLIADPVRPGDPPDCASCGTPAAYVWRDGRFEPVGEGEHPHIDQRL